MEYRSYTGVIVIYNYFEQLCFGFVQIVEWQFNMALAGVNMALAGVNIALAVLNMALAGV